MPVPIPPLQLSNTQTAQSGARSDGYQAGVYTGGALFGDFSVVGGGRNGAGANPASLGAPEYNALRGNTFTIPQLSTQNVLIALVALGGLVWLLHRK